MADEPIDTGETMLQEPDYKQLYEQAKANSRKWEKQAKANKTAAEQLEKAQQAGKTAEEKIAELTKRLDEKEKAEAHAKLVATVAKEKGVPAELLFGDTQEEIEAHADALAKYAKKDTAPQVPNAGKFARKTDASSPSEAFEKFWKENT